MSTAIQYWSGKRVFVTGGTGFLGRWLVAELVGRGAAPTLLVRESFRPTNLLNANSLSELPIVTGSVESYDSLLGALLERRPDVVFHLAGQSLTGEAKKFPLQTLETNVRGTWNLLEACRQSSVPQIVVASSDKVYASTAELPYRETHPLMGDSPYAVSKGCADLICRMYASTYGLRVAMARFPIIFGGGDPNFSRLIPDVVRTTLAGQRFVINSDGKSGRDFVYVHDAVLALMTLAERLDSEPSLAGEAFNFSLEIRVTVLEMVRTVAKLMSASHLVPIVKGDASVESRDSYMCCEKARQLLDWTPRWELEEALKETISWYQHNSGVEAHNAVEVLD